MRGEKFDAGGPEKQLIFFVWPKRVPFSLLAALWASFSPITRCRHELLSCRAVMSELVYRMKLRAMKGLTVGQRSRGFSVHSAIRSGPNG
jgi:hypothetical protein